MKYYAAKNAFGSNTSVGFAITWDVFVFDSIQARKKFLDRYYSDLSVRAIKRDQVTSYLYNSPKPFSDEYYGLVLKGNADDREHIATVEICGGNSAFYKAERFY